MKMFVALSSICTLALTGTAFAAEGIPSFYGDPPDEHHPWAVHDPNRPQPPVVTPGTFSSQEQPGKPPSDAIVLFDGTDLSKWVSTKGKGGPANWDIEKGQMIVAKGAGNIRTKEEFGDCQLHIEWSEPANITGSSQGRGNSGVFLMGRYEVQVLDCYHNITYADGAAGALYGQDPPMANALRPPGQFQVYDIIFRRPVYKSGQEIAPGYVTVLVNGVVVQDHTVIEGPSGHMRRTRPGPAPEKGALELQDHGNPVRFRNIWLRPLPPRRAEGGTNGYLTPEATMAKRREIAADIRQDAATLRNPADPTAGMLRLMESLEYEKTDAVVQQVEQMGNQYVASLKALPPAQLASKKTEAKHVQSAFQFLARHQILPADFAPKAGLDEIVKAQKWDKK